MIEQVILITHVLIALAIVGLILLQQGKGAEMGASFGGGGSQTLFGASGGGNVLTRATAVLATVFFMTSFGLAIIAKQKASSVGAGELMGEVVEQIEAVEPPLEFDLDHLPLGETESIDEGQDIPDIGTINSSILDQIPE